MATDGAQPADTTGPEVEEVVQTGPAGGHRGRSQPSMALAHVLGARLKRLRLQRRLTLQEVGASVDLSHSFLSMLERGQADISLARVHRLATFFGVPLGELLTEDDDGAKPRVIPADEGMLVERSPGITLRLLPIARSLGLQVAQVRLEPGAGPSTPVSHDGDDFLWVIRGELVLTHGADDYVLEKGQAVFYSARVHHHFGNRSARPAEMLSITTPPYGRIAIPAESAGH
jgi:transcriptional regulator with XRE-family HTH domain